MTTVAIVGGSLSGNRGAASMVHGVVDGLRAGDVTADVVVLTPLPDDDRSVDQDLPLVDFGPVEIIRSVLEAGARRATGSGPLGPASRAIVDADVVVDVSGISFVDTRGGATLAYNVALLLPALLLGTPVVKAAQAMGPFERPANRRAARAILDAIDTVLTRGDHTHELVTALGITARRADDVAFLMDIGDHDRAWARAIAATDDYVVVSPSAVVVAQDPDSPYEDVVAELVAELARDRTVLLLPHSSRPGRPESKLNDLPLCQRLADAVGPTTWPVRVVGADASPQQMRALLERADLCVTSRFHAMISSLAVATPVVVVSWSHKYREVLAAFDLADMAVDFTRVTPEELRTRVRRALDDGASVRERIRASLPAVRERAWVNIAAIRDQLELHR